MLSTLPEAWSKLVAEEDDLLLELIADKVESLCGFKPDIDAVARFLRESVSLRTDSVPRAPASPSSLPAFVPAAKSLTAAPRQPPPASAPAAGAIGFSFAGRFVPCRNGREVLVRVFETLAQRDASFLERFASRPKHGRTRRYLARSPAELYPGRPDLASEHFFKLQSGWCLGTNVSHAQIERIIEMACEVSRVRLGGELVINVGE